MDWLNYHHLLNFWLVAREGSVQGASQALHVTPASVSIQVRQLEKSLGVKLLQKRGRGVAVTDIGQRVSEYAEEIFATGRELQEMLRGQPSGRPLVLRVGLREMMPKMLAFELLRPALELDEQVRLVCIEGDMPELVSDLAIHKLDVVLSDTALDPQFRIQAHSHRLGESEVVIMGASRLAKQYRQNFPESLSGAPFVLPLSQNALRRQLDRWFSDLMMTPQIRAEIADSAMMKIMGQSGLGLIAIPAVIEKQVSKMYRLSRVGVAEGVSEQFYAVSAVRKVTHPAVLAIQGHAFQGRPQRREEL